MTKSDTLSKLTEQEIDALANVDLDMPSSKVRSRIFLTLGAFVLLSLGLCGYVSLNVDLFVDASGNLSAFDLAAAKVEVYKRLLQASILTLIVLLDGFFNFFFTLAAFSVFVISLFSLIEDFSSRLALGATDLSHITIIVITIRIMAIAVLRNLVHYIVRRS